MGFYVNIASTSLHTDVCNSARVYAEASKKAGGDSNWLWFESYTEAFLYAAKIGRSLGIHMDCAPKADAVDKRVMALYEHLVGRFG